jgi:hypothetical protein
MAVTVEIIGTAKQAGSVYKGHGDLALAESYRDSRPKPREI